MPKHAAIISTHATFDGLECTLTLYLPRSEEAVSPWRPDSGVLAPLIMFISLTGRKIPCLVLTCLQDVYWLHAYQCYTRVLPYFCHVSVRPGCSQPWISGGRRPEGPCVFHQCWCVSRSCFQSVEDDVPFLSRHTVTFLLPFRRLIWEYICSFDSFLVCTCRSGGEGTGVGHRSSSCDWFFRYGSFYRNKVCLFSQKRWSGS